MFRQATSVIVLISDNFPQTHNFVILSLSNDDFSAVYVMYRKGLNLRGMRKVRVDKFFAPPEKNCYKGLFVGSFLCLSVCPVGAAWLPLNAVLLNLILGTSIEICQTRPALVKI